MPALAAIETLQPASRVGAEHCADFFRLWAPTKRRSPKLATEGVVFVLVAVCGVVCVLAGLLALVATRLERMAVALLVIGVAEAAVVVAMEPAVPSSAWPMVLVLVLGAVAMSAVVLGAMAVLEVDARPARQLRPWKLLLLVPLALLALRLGPGLLAASAAPPSSADNGALAIAFVTIASAALAVPLLARRREAI